jgi:hypothetical protein
LIPRRLNSRCGRSTVPIRRDGAVSRKPYRVVWLAAAAVLLGPAEKPLEAG